jgi:MFS family permease
MQIKVNPSVLGQTKWYEYAVRFLFGGLITAVAGLVALRFGPGIGGLFLAFPAIFPASATLIEKHESQKKEKQELQGKQRGRQAASVDAAGSAMGSIGLSLFALLVWQFLPRHNTWIVLIAATAAWLSVSVLIWHIRKQT